MIENKDLANRRAESIVELLEIPQSYYQLAAQRYQSFGDWICRLDSTILHYKPTVSPQGSFRYGTVIRPLHETDEYDLDLVVELLKLTKRDKSQKQLKEMLGHEVKAYKEAKNLNEEPEEKNRCWRLNYSDRVNFHMDILPAANEDESFKKLLQQHGVDPDLAATAIAITDKRLPKYAIIDDEWPRSNPKGFAKWFEQKMLLAAEPRLIFLLEQRLYASVDEIPAWEWKTPLQRAIQFLKRHRDVMFKNQPEFAPISMIITTLAAHSYQNEVSLYDALVGIVERMPNFISSYYPRVANPTNPAEDFADKWKNDLRYEQSFWQWYTQVKADIASLARPFETRKLKEHISARMQVDLTEQTAISLTDDMLYSVAPLTIISSAPKPWSKR